MAAIVFSRIRTVELFEKHLPSCLRHYSSSTSFQEPKTRQRNRSNEEAKQVSSPKTKRARDMAKIINRSPWSSELESSLSPLCSALSKTTVLQTLRLIKNPSQALKFFNWVQGKEGFAHNDQSYFLMLEILGRTRNLNAARNFLFSIDRRSAGAFRLEDKYFNSLIRSYGQAGLFQESIKLFETMKEMGVSPSVITFNNLFSVLLKRGRTNMVKSLYDEMRRTYGVTPDTYTFNLLIRGFCMNSMVDEGFHFFKEMSRFTCQPDVVTYNTLVDGLCRVGKVKVAYNVVKGMIKKSSDLHPNIITYTTLIRGFCMKGEVDDALAVLEDMVSRGLKPNEITFNTLIKGLCEAERFDKIKEILDGTVVGLGSFLPDTCTLNTLIHAHCNAGNLSEAVTVFGRMQQLKISPDSATYSVLIRSLCQRQEFEKAEEYFDELLKTEILLSESGCRPLVAAYNPMFEHLCKTGKTIKAEKLFRQLMRRGVQDPPSYQTIITGHCSEGSFEVGYELLVLMLRRDFEPGCEIYLSLINGLLAKGNPLLAHETLQKMLRSSHYPRTSIFHSVLSELLQKEYAEESTSLVLLMLEKDIRQNRNLSTATVKLLFSRGLRCKAMGLVKLLYQKGFVVEMEELIDFLCETRRFLEAHELTLFALEKQERIGSNLCDSILKGLCGKKRVSEAFTLFYELVETEAHGKLSCLEELIAVLLAEGKEPEAEFVSKRMPT